MLDGKGIFRAAIDEKTACSGGKCADKHPFQNLERHAFHKGTVHKCTGVSFVRIADHDLFGIFLCGKKTPFHSGGEPGTAASSQTGFLHGFDNRIRTHFKGLGKGGKSAVCLVFLHIFGVDPSGKTGDHELFQFLSFSRYGKTVLFPQGKNVIDAFFIPFHMGIENGSIVRKFHFHERFSITMTDTACFHDRNRKIQCPESCYHFPCPGSKSAGGGTDLDAFDFCHLMPPSFCIH